MSHRPENMRHAQALVRALDGLKVNPPKVLTNITSGFDLLGTPIQPTVTDPGNAIVTAAADGKLNLDTLDEMLMTAATEAATNGYRQEFRLRAERKFAQRFHTALVDGAADKVLDSLRPLFNTAAEELTSACAAIDLQGTPQRLLNVTATTDEQAAWGRLPDLVRQVDRIGAIAAAFGPGASLPVVDDLNGTDTLLRLEWIDDRALMCTDGDLLTACNAFRQANPSWQTSPWLRVDLKLATITEAQERYREMAESDWASREHHFAGSGTLGADGFVPHVRQNPHQRAEAAV